MTDPDKEAFFATVVHEMRAPLNACLMSLNLLELKASQPAEVMKAAEVIRRNLDRQAALIQNLSDVVQIAFGGIEILAEPVELEELIDRAVDNRQPAAADRQITLERVGGPGEYPLEADSERIVQVFGTLLEELVATAEPGSRVTVELSSGGADVAAVELCAQGTDRSQPAPPERAREQKSFAIRLSIIEHLLRCHGGSLESGRSGFTVKLPLKGGAPA